MNKTESIARRILGWKLNRWDRWYDYEEGEFIYDSDFQPEQNLAHAMQIVDKLEECGFTYTIKGKYEVCFNHFTGSGVTLAQAITNAAYAIIERHTNDEDTKIRHQIC